MELRLFLFSASGVEHKILAAWPILCIAEFKGRENWISLYRTKNVYPSKLSYLRICCPSRTFGQWNEFERFVVLFSTIRLKGEVNFCTSRSFLKVFYLPSAFIGIGSYSGIFHLKSFSKCFQPWGIKYLVNLYIILYVASSKI